MSFSLIKIVYSVVIAVVWVMLQLFLGINYILAYWSKEPSTFLEYTIFLPFTLTFRALDYFKMESLPLFLLLDFFLSWLIIFITLWLVFYLLSNRKARA